MLARRIIYPVAGLVTVFSMSNFSLAATTGDGGVDGFGMEDHSQSCNTKRNTQTLSEPDFDGNGVVDQTDLTLVSDAVALAEQSQANTGKRKYTAFYDINNDNKLDKHDISKTNAKIGKESTALDQQIATLFHAAIKYEDINEALRDGYIPFTQEYQNHGVHMIRFLPGDANVLDENFDPAVPEGLNYDRYGNLVGVFFYIGPNVDRLMKLSDPNLPAAERADIEAYFSMWLSGEGISGVKPAAFVPDSKGINQDHWHFHQGICSRNLMAPIPGRGDNKSVFDLSSELVGRALAGDYIDPQEPIAVANNLDVRQCDLVQPCTSAGGVYIPRFYMLHMWLFNKNNRCGIFWGTHEDISVNDLEVDVDPATIPTEQESFVLQAGGEFMLNTDGSIRLDANGEPIANKNYRKMCLDTSVTAGMVYDNPANPNLDPNFPIGVRQYIEANAGHPDVEQSLICPPSSTGVEADEYCLRQLLRD